MKYNILSKDDVNYIHQSTLEVLERVGIKVYSTSALTLLKNAGAYVDEKNKIVKIPSYLIDECVKKAPSEFTLYARNPKNDVKIEPGKVYFGPMIGRIYILDLDSGEKRKTTLEDVANLTKLASALEYYKLPHSGVMMPHIEGVPDEVAHAYAYLISVKNSEKVVKGSGRNKVVAHDCIRMASILAGCEMEELRKKPNIFTTCNTVAPLQLQDGQTEGLIEYAKYGLPVDIAAEIQAGATGPVTLAGSLVVQNAEVLSGITVAQLVNPGTPVFYGTASTIMDMRSGIIAKGAVEAGLFNVATAQLAQYYGIPSRGTAGDTESKILDIQAGYEKAITLLMAALAGVNYIWYPGTLEYALTVSYESILIDHEICGMIYRALKGIDVNEKTLAIGVIEKVGPGEQYLGQRHTIEYLMSEQYFPKLSDRRSREEWKAIGAKELREVARVEVRKILKEYQPMPLEKSVENELEQVVKEIEKRELKS
ncbi:MAG: trimethylamine methyltransferase family protein [Nitrososphaeria archaeon]